MPHKRCPPSSSTAPDGSTTSTSAHCAHVPAVGPPLQTRARGVPTRPRARLVLPWGSSSGMASAVSTSTGASMSMASPTRPLALFSRTTKAPTLRSRRLGVGCTSGDGRPAAWLQAHVAWAADRVLFAGAIHHRHGECVPGRHPSAPLNSPTTSPRRPAFALLVQRLWAIVISPDPYKQKSTALDGVSVGWGGGPWWGSSR